MPSSTRATVCADATDGSEWVAWLSLVTIAVPHPSAVMVKVIIAAQYVDLCLRCEPYCRDICLASGSGGCCSRSRVQVERSSCWIHRFGNVSCNGSDAKMPGESVLSLDPHGVALSRCHNATEAPRTTLSHLEAEGRFVCPTPCRSPVGAKRPSGAAAGSAGHSENG